MIAIAKANDTRIISDGAEGWITVPDIKIPQGIEWSASEIPGQTAFFVTFEHNSKKATTLWHGPHEMPNGDQVYFIDAPKRVLQMLKNQLGAENVRPLVRALRLSRPIRRLCKQLGFSLVRNGRGGVVTVMPPLVICGTNPVDMDDDDIEEAEELTDLK